MSSSNSPCAACKCLRRKCTQECVFAPYFPPDNPQKFTNVHKVFGASNVSKLLNELNAGQREDAVNSLAYEAEYRLRDPVYGCVGLISILQHRLRLVQNDLESAKKELATYIGPSAMLPILNHPPFVPLPQGLNYTPGGGGGGAYQMMPYNVAHPMMGVPQLSIRDPPPQQQYMEAVAAQEMIRTYEQQQNELLRFNGGFDEGGAPVTATGFNQMQPSLALGASYEALPYSHHVEEHLQPQQLLIQQNNQQQQQQQQRAKSEEGGSIAPLC
ncbi:hypothetical protein ACS0TY_030095 [Phlomoides rotata]